MISSVTTPDQSGQAAGQAHSKERQSQAHYTATKYAPFEAFMTKLEDLDAYSDNACNQFPKFEKFLLASEIRHCNNALLKQAVIAFKRKQKSSALFEADVQLYILRRFIRKAHKKEYIDPRKYKVWTGHTIELGSMLGGWIRHESKNG